ncbi:transmembrane protein, putative [Medicago truncatula]|uniref:Transmembrane protein, putative n=1 Tax=Medicago truncatula TaxID=3880 RepID=A0A072TSG9_MEDTR|nr:transmembrane protein, putative [Medicago truncatula]
MSENLPNAIVNQVIALSASKDIHNIFGWEGNHHPHVYSLPFKVLIPYMIILLLGLMQLRVIGRLYRVKKVPIISILSCGWLPMSAFSQILNEQVGSGESTPKCQNLLINAFSLTMNLNMINRNLEVLKYT